MAAVLPDPVPAEAHAHSTVELYIFFAAGQALHILRRASAAVQSVKNPIKSRCQYVTKFWDIFLIRGVFAGLTFAVWLKSPDALARNLGLDLVLPANPAIAFGGGLLTDLVLDWIGQKVPRLGREIPQLPSDEPPPPAA
jgi:hypothetical protein